MSSNQKRTLVNLKVPDLLYFRINCANLQTQTSSGTVMGRSTAQTQRKVKIPAGLKKRLKKAKVEKVVESQVVEEPLPACEIPSCGCGN